MFTVKATYRNETRKFTFPEDVVFPTYEQLARQLCRVFPLSHSYYLVKLVFSPDSSKPGRILIGKEVHSAEEYSQRVAPLQRSWPNPRLRFTVLESTSHRVPTVVEQSAQQMSGSLPCKVISSNLVVCKPPSLVPDSPSFIPPPPPPVSKYPSPPKSLPVPPPPILFPPSGHAFGKSEDATVASSALNGCFSPPCCSIAKGKADIKALFVEFQEKMDHIMHVTFGVDCAEKTANSESSSTAAHNGATCPIPADETYQSLKSDASVPSRWCFVCRTSFTGIWYGCVKCPWHAICPGCFAKSGTAHTLSFGPSHVVEQRSSPGSPFLPPEPDSSELSVGLGVSDTPSGINHTAKATDVPVHRGVICDSCDQTITGIRHKCLDCPDYDLCTPCMRSGVLATHNPFHEFFDIETPGRVYVHTVFSGGHTRARTTVGSAVQTKAIPSREGSDFPLPVRHPATCNLCDSSIVGERFKCISCPDFDTCSACFAITPEQHPGHGFVKLARVEDLMVRGSLAQCQVAHLAACNSCGKAIRGIRYKCMHLSCADFDLCSNCEALPIPVHPLTHPMLKLKTVDTVIPTVYRVGQTSLNDGPSYIEPESDSLGLPSHSRANPPSTDLQGRIQNPASVSPLITPLQVEKPLDKGAGEPHDEYCEVARGSAVAGSSSETESIAKSPVGIAHISETSPVALGMTLDVYKQLWPKVNEEVKATHVHDVKDRPVDPVGVEELDGDNSIMNREALLATPATLPVPCIIGCHTSISDLGNHSLATVLDDHRTPSPVSPGVAEPQLASLSLLNEHLALESLSLTDKKAPKASLSAAFVADTTIPDGQVFPPGAEFVKSWHMVNDGDQPWPSTTELRFVAGETFVSGTSTELKTKIGYVDQGERLDVWTGELKAPDIPGRYVGYWRLNDGQGNFFGSSIWIDLTVADQQSSDEEHESLLAVSSMVMPSPNPASSIEPETVSPPSTKPASDVSEDSDGFSVSLISVPSWDDDVAERQGTTPTEPLEYVVVYDSNSEDD